MASPHIVIAIPCHAAGGPRAFDIALTQFLAQTRLQVTVCHAMSGVLPGARNRLVRDALKLKADYMWWLDDDQPFAPDDLEKLLARHVDAVVPLAPRRSAPFLPLIYSTIDGMHAHQHFLEPDEHGLIRIAAAGLGGLLIKTECFTKISTDGWFEFVHPDDNFDDYAEDFPFYKKLAAVGVPLYCDLDVRFGHVVSSVAYILRQQGQWVTVLADVEPFVAFPQPKHPLSLANAPRLVKA